ncbi:hypothetical protein LINPERPRIM_LOCUS25806, partial [Linum perenne]
SQKVSSIHTAGGRDDYVAPISILLLILIPNPQSKIDFSTRSDGHAWIAIIPSTIFIKE